MHVSDIPQFGPLLVFGLGLWVHLAGQKAKREERARQNRIDADAAEGKEASEEVARSERWKKDAEQWRLRCKELETEVEYRNKRLLDFGTSGYEEMFALLDVPGSIDCLRRRRSAYLRKQKPV